MIGHGELLRAFSFARPIRGSGHVFQVIVPTRSNYGREINVKNRNKSTILIFLSAIIELVQELLISNMHNKLEEDTCENVEVIAPRTTRSNY